MEGSPARPEPPRGLARGPWIATYQGLCWLAALWTALVLGGAIWALQSERSEHLNELRTDAQHRAQSLASTLSMNLRQLDALSRALSRQPTFQTFLRQYDSRLHAESDTNSLRAALLADPDVLARSELLQTMARDFAVSGIFLLDSRGRVLTDSRTSALSEILGQDLKPLRYVYDALASGTGAQFTRDLVAPRPAFFFATQVSQNEQALGVLVVQQGIDAFEAFPEDTQHRLLVTDAFGVVVLGNHAEDILRLGPFTEHSTLNEAQLLQRYQTSPRPLPWTALSNRPNVDGVHQVMIDGQPHLVVKQALGQGAMTAWALAPLNAANANLVRTVLLAVLALSLGYWLLASMNQRRLRTQASLRERQELQDMAHTLPVVVFRYRREPDGQGRFTFVGQHVKEMLGVDAQSLQADPELPWRMAGLSEPVPPPDPVEFSVPGQPQQQWIRCMASARDQADGSTTYNGYWSNVTERRRLQARSEVVFNHTPSAFVFFTLERGIYRCNAGALRLFNAEREQALLGLKLDRPPLSPLKQADGRPTSELAQAVFERLGELPPQVINFEWCHTRLDGERFDADIELIPFEEDGQANYCAVIQNITARKLTEVAMKEARATAEANAQAKSSFLANMSHEIRTPMNAIMGMTHLALQEPLNERARNYLSKAHGAAANLLHLLNDVLDVSKIESGKLELERTPFRLDEVLDHLADVLAVRAQEKGLELVFSARPDIPFALQGDPYRLGQILINLGNNAIKFTARGTVVVGAEVVQRSGRDVQLHCWVSDTGIGMSQEVMDQLFQPFTQGDSSTTRQFGGTGLGLNISRQLVEMMGGRIWATSQPGQGSTFHFNAHFDVLRADTAARALSADELRGQHVLLVDDNPTARAVLASMLRDVGLVVEEAGGGPQALLALQASASTRLTYDLVLVDWDMPGMNGTDFVRKALSADGPQPRYLMMVAGLSRSQVEQEDLPLDGILNKPLTPSGLFDGISQALCHATAPCAPAAPAPADPAANTALRGARVLLVEDQALNQELACALLERAGMEVVVTHNGQDALQLLERDDRFDAVLMDCQMPIMDGYAAAQRIREQPRWRDLPIIAMTASAMSHDRERVLASGMNDHISKPLDLRHMFSVLTHWIRPGQAGRMPDAGA